MAVPEYVTAEELAAVLGPAAPAARVELAVSCANLAIATWAPQAPDTTTDPPTPIWAPVDGLTQEAAMRTAHLAYQTQAATGSVYSADDLLARLPADWVRGIRDLLDAATTRWGLA